MKPMVAGVIAGIFFAGMACTNHYQDHFQPANGAVLGTLKGSSAAVVEVIVLPKSAHKAAADEKGKSSALLGESRFQTSDSIAGGDLTAFAGKIGSDFVLSSKEFIATKQELVTHERRHRSVTHGTVNGKAVVLRTETWVPYPEWITLTVYEYWGTFFRKVDAPTVLP